MGRGLLPAELTALGITPTFSVRVLVAGLTVSVVAALVVAWLPAVLVGRIGSRESLTSHSRGATPGRRPHQVRQALVVVEIAVALVLFVGAGLMAHSLGQLHRMDPGVDTTNVLTMRLTLPREKYDDVAVERFFDDLVTRVTGTPGVTAGAAASQFPPEVFASTRFRFEGAHGIPDSLPTADLTVVTPGTFRVLGIPMRSGRPLSETDRASTPPVVVVNESFAKRYYPAGSAIGQRIAVGEESRAGAWEIVGVVGDTRGRGVAVRPEPEIYVPLAQDPDRWNQLFLLVRTAGSPTQMLPAMRRIIAEMDPEQPVYAIRTLEDAFAATTLQHRTATILLVVFAGLAVALAALGVYAVMAQSVAARRQEIGVRMALGAGSADVVRMITGQALCLLLIGASLGVMGGVALGRVASSLLVGTKPSDPFVLAAVTAALVATGLAAGWLPARRASRIDPASALRSE